MMANAPVRGVDMDAEGLSDMFAEPEEEEQPRPKATTNEDFASRMRALAGSHRDMRTPEKTVQETRMPSSAPQPQQTQLAGGNFDPGDAALPDGEVDPAHIMGTLQERQRQTSFFNGDLPQGDMTEDALAELMGTR